MTGREHLNRRKLRLGGAVLAGVVLLAAGIAAMPALGGGVGAVAAVPGMLALAGAALAGQLAFRCPWCRAHLGRLLMHSGFLRIDPKLRYCPYCGAEFDEELDGGPAWDDPVE